MKFRLKLDLSQFYDDERHLAYILVDPKWEEVICLQEHVQRLFDVPEVQFLTDDGIYIPPLESIDVIKSNDVLRAIIPHKFQKKKSKSKVNRYVTEPTDVSLEINGDKRKCDDDETLMCSTPNLCPKKKRRTSSKKKESADSVTFKVEDDFIKVPTLQQNNNTVSSTMNGNEPDKLQTRDRKASDTQADDVIDDTVKSRKRKRTRKNKKSVPNLEKDDKDNRLSSVPVPISSSTFRLSKTMSTPSSSAKHVHFSDGDLTLVEDDQTSKEGRVVYRSLLGMETSARIIQAEVKDVKKEDDSHYKKPVIEIRENILLVPAPGNHVSPLNVDQSDLSVIEVDDSAVASDADEVSQEIDVNCQDVKVDKILPLSEELTEMPNVGDVILFKVYQLSEENTPGISEYICGRCERINPTEKTLNCLVLDGIDQLDENLLRLTPSDENHVKSLKKFKTFQFYFNEMLDRRVFRM